jgi:sugar phosphate isomerase/epimerase
MRLTVFSKPWPSLSPDELGRTMKELGFGGIEYPLREGFQVEPGSAKEKMPAFVEALARHGVGISSIASDLSEESFAACQLAGANLIRVMCYGEIGENYLECEDRWLRGFEAVYPLCEKYGVKIGVQNHFGHNRLAVFTSMELKHLLDRCDKRYVGAVWDAGHCALAYEVPEQGLDTIWDHLLLVNLKNGYVKRFEDIETGKVSYLFYMTKGDEGAICWKRIIGHLKKRGYNGDLCLSGEYSQHDLLMHYIQADVKYLYEIGI